MYLCLYYSWREMKNVWTKHSQEIRARTTKPINTFRKIRLTWMKVRKIKKRRGKIQLPVHWKASVSLNKETEINDYGHIRSEKGKRNAHSSQIKVFEEKAACNSIDKTCYLSKMQICEKSPQKWNPEQIKLTPAIFNRNQNHVDSQLRFKFQWYLNYCGPWRGGGDF